MVDNRMVNKISMFTVNWGIGAYNLHITHKSERLRKGFLKKGN